MEEQGKEVTKAGSAKGVFHNVVDGVTLFFCQLGRKIQEIYLLISFGKCGQIFETKKVETTIKLPSGGRMPILGSGTWHPFYQFSEMDTIGSLHAALEAGYRHFDLSPVHLNETEIGIVLKEWFNSGKITRDELFIVSKLSPMGNIPPKVEKYLNKTLKDLQLDYLDLFLIQLPVTFKEAFLEFTEEHEKMGLLPAPDLWFPWNLKGEVELNMNTDNKATWKEMEQLVHTGKVRAIGLSNFNIPQIEEIIQIAQVPISNLQIEMHVYFQQKELHDFCKSKGIPITAHTPLGSAGYIKTMQYKKIQNFYNPLLDPRIEVIALKHGKSTAQVLLRFLIQKGVSVIPKSVDKKRLQENMDVFNWNLDSSDMTDLESFKRGSEARVVDYTAVFKGIDKHPKYPFKV
ncbi:1,5-anhydro-D-fructose reductase-like isoform X2 [Leptopilina heterotoma]|nr:1,5-anhydro-D-fructose reductase-like isoform X2 [Leptopilina heterotoma]XP_043480401.1 1,5-anhydro-D-fructose reductase-like isoform X2 [Leptopilina heterotoma]